MSEHVCIAAWSILWNDLHGITHYLGYRVSPATKESKYLWRWVFAHLLGAAFSVLLVIPY